MNERRECFGDFDSNECKESIKICFCDDMRKCFEKTNMINGVCDCLYRKSCPYKRQQLIISRYIRMDDCDFFKIKYRLL